MSAHAVRDRIVERNPLLRLHRARPSYYGPKRYRDAAERWGRG